MDNYAYIIDCGNGVAQQFIRAGLPFSALRAAFITHHHSDHNADVGTFFLLGWSGLSARTPVLGPPPLESILKSFLETNRYGIDIRVADEGKPWLDELIVPQDISAVGVVFEDERVRVTTTLVDHPPVWPTLAYRIDTADRSIVISGDTRPSSALVELARGADVLVHEVLYEPAIAHLEVANNGRTLRKHLLNSHTPVSEVGPLAERAGVPLLVLSHLVPSNDIVDDDTWRREAQRGYSGRVVVGTGLARL